MYKLVNWVENCNFDVEVVLKLLQIVQVSGQNGVPSIWMVCGREGTCGMPGSDEKSSFLG